MAEECGGLVPPAPKKVTAVSGPGAGKITLYWDEASYANRYAVAYGEVSGKYVYGADNIGGERSRSFTVSALKPGTRYYFRLAAANNKCSSPFSAEVSAVTSGSAVYAAVPVTVVPTLEKKAVAPVPVTGESLSAVSGPGVGQVTLTWREFDGADNYHLAYGRQAGKFEYGALNIGKTTKFTVSRLNPGTSYYFAIVPVTGSQAMKTSSPVKAWAKAAVNVVQTTREALIMPQNTPRVGSEQQSSKKNFEDLTTNMPTVTVVPTEVSTAVPTIEESSVLPPPEENVVLPEEGEVMPEETF